MEAILGVKPACFALSHEAHIRPLGHRRTQMIDQGGDERLAQAQALMRGLNGAISTTWKNRPPSAMTLPMPTASPFLLTTTE
jgi:hypothetical protein